MTLFLVRNRIDRVALRLFAGRRRLDDDDLNYALHTALRETFGPAAPQPFRWPVPKAAPDILLGYCADPEPLMGQGADLPDWSQDWPDTTMAPCLFAAPFEARPMAERYEPGARFGFNLRVRPVRRYGGRVRDLRGGAGERDAFLAALEARDARGGTAESDPLDRETVYTQWLAERLTPAAELEVARVVSFQRHRLRRKDASGKRKKVEGPDAEFDGILRVADANAFTQLLARGVGRHRAFGFGMLLLRPPGR